VARGAWIRDLISVGHRWRDEGEGMRSHFHIRNGGFDFRHMTGDATASRRPFFVVSMFLDGACAWAVQRERAMAIHA
jgi:hypothetical protein